VLRANAQQRSARRQIFGRLDQDLWRLRPALHIATSRSPTCLNTAGEPCEGRLHQPPTPGQFATVKATAHTTARRNLQGGNPEAEDPLNRNKGSCAYPYPRASARPGSRRSQTYERKRPPGNISDPPRNRIAPLVSDGPSSMADSVGGTAALIATIKRRCALASRERLQAPASCLLVKPCRHQGR